MTATHAPRFAFPLTVSRFVRNGKYPDRAVQNWLATTANHAARWHSKEVFSYSVPIDDLATEKAGDRWQFAWRAGPYVRYLWARAIMGPRSGTAAADAVTTLTVSDGSTVGTMEFHPGDASTGAGASDTPAYWTVATAILKNAGSPVELTADTEYFGVVTDSYTRCLSITVYETSLEADTGNGYASLVNVGAPILDTDRSTVATIARSMWKQGGAQLLNWTVDDVTAERTTTSATNTNLIDTSLTGANAYGAAAAGYVLDLSHRARVASDSHVPITMYVKAAKGTSDGTVELLANDSSVIATVTITSTVGWYAATALVDTTFWADPSNALCHLVFRSAGGTLAVYAVSVYQYE